MRANDRTDLSLNALGVVRLEAVLELAVLAAQADGQIDDRERSVFRAQVVKRSGGAIDDALARVLLERLETMSRSQHSDERLARLRERLGDARMRESALEMAAQIVFADHALHVNEAAFLERAVAVLEIDPARALQIVADARSGE